MATISAKLPFEQGTTVQLSAAVDVFPDKTRAYVCEYFWLETKLVVRVRVDDESLLGSFDLVLPLTGIEAFGTA